MIVYEVNIKIPINLFDEYLIWLNNHISHMLTFNGFIKSKIYKINTDAIREYENILVHYYLDSFENLQFYFDNNSKIMRNQVDEKFKKNILIQRRILNEI